MAAFPKLKTNAVAQYPATKAIQFKNQALRFVDGVEQRYRDSAGALHRWTIRLDQLDDTEMGALDNFFIANQGSFGNFAFTDPWDGTAYPSCSLSSDQMYLASLEELQGNSTLTIIENRG
jgi:hypothetical protein